MQKAKAEQNGFSVIELLIALTLMALLGTSLLTVIATGSNAFGRIFAEKDGQNEARIALSYVTVKLRQNGARDTVSIVESGSETNVRNVLKIDGTPGDVTDDCYFIYFEEAPDGMGGRLVEKTANTPGVDDPRGAQKIAGIRDFSIAYADEAHAKIRITVTYDSAAAGGADTRETVVALRAAPGPNVS
jgi:prepilin-type N-terminal cleavage/methylation domain-containing protein